MANARVALTRGDDRYDNIARALALIADQIEVRSKKHIVIKPNFVLTHVDLAATHVDAVRAVLDFLRSRTDARITIAEGTAIGDTLDSFRNFGYLDLLKQCDVELVDINRGDWLPVEVYAPGFKNKQLRMSRMIMESDLRISVGPPKTHDTVIATLSLKNMVMGSLIRDQRNGHKPGRFTNAANKVRRSIPNHVRNDPTLAPAIDRVVQKVMRSDKMAMHMGYPLINLNLCRLAPHVFPHLAVIDGFLAMEGSGPAFGDPVDLRCAVAGTDFLAADTVGLALMGLSIDEIGYLRYCKLKGMGVGELDKIEVVGESLAACRRVFRLAPDAASQRRWAIGGVEQYL